jgi:hypothetical protein
VNFASLAASTCGSVTVVASKVTRAALGEGTKAIAIVLPPMQLTFTVCPHGIAIAVTCGVS